jgi:hypothetical protein
MAGYSSKVVDAHTIGSIRDFDLGMFAVADIAAEYADAFTPVHLVTRMPDATDAGLQGLGAPAVSLTGLAWFPRWQPPSTGHITPR